MEEKKDKILVRDGIENPEEIRNTCSSCDTDETDEEWDDRTKNSPKLFLYLLVGVIIITASILSLKYVYNPQLATPTGGMVATEEHHPTTELSSRYMYNGQKFYKEGDMWHTEIKKENTLWDVELYYGPRELENIPLSGDFTDVFDLDEVYVTFDPREQGNLKYLALAVGHLDTSLIKSFRKQITAGCIVNETDACINVPVINCENTDDNVVFFLKTADSPGVTMEDNCVTIQGSEWQLIQATEKFLMKAYGVI
ncbi:hypothetical protein ACFLYT_01055 [Nanoarchaeota archaeon]